MPVYHETTVVDYQFMVGWRNDLPAICFNRPFTLNAVSVKELFADRAAGRTSQIVRAKYAFDVSIDHLPGPRAALGAFELRSWEIAGTIVHPPLLPNLKSMTGGFLDVRPCGDNQFNVSIFGRAESLDVERTETQLLVLRRDFARHLEALLLASGANVERLKVNPSRIDSVSLLVTFS